MLKDILFAVETFRRRRRARHSIAQLEILLRQHREEEDAEAQHGDFRDRMRARGMIE